MMTCALVILTLFAVLLSASGATGSQQHAISVAAFFEAQVLTSKEMDVVHSLTSDVIMSTVHALDSVRGDYNAINKGMTRFLPLQWTLVNQFTSSVDKNIIGTRLKQVNGNATLCALVGNWDSASVKQANDRVAADFTNQFTRNCMISDIMVLVFINQVADAVRNAAKNDLQMQDVFHLESTNHSKYDDHMLLHLPSSVCVESVAHPSVGDSKTGSLVVATLCQGDGCKCASWLPNWVHHGLSGTAVALIIIAVVFFVIGLIAIVHRYRRYREAKKQAMDDKGAPLIPGTRHDL